MRTTLLEILGFPACNIFVSLNFFSGSLVPVSVTDLDSNLTSFENTKLLTY
jgi:hypothetical protein